MLLITPIIIGAVIGPLVAVVFGRQRFLIQNAIMGILGALILRLITYFVLVSKGSESHGLSFIGVFSSFIGALIVPYVFKLFPPVRAKKEK